MDFELCQCGHGLTGFEGNDFQRGHGLTGFEGLRFQKGHGLWSNLFRFIKPAFKWIGKRALETGVGVATDVLAGDNLKESARKHLKTQAQNVVEKATDKSKELADKLTVKAMKFIKQKGKGRRRRRAKRKAPVLRRVGRPRKLGRKKTKNVQCKRRRRRRTTKRRTSRATESFDFLQ